MASNYTYKYIIDEYGQIVYPRTALSAVDLITANGIQVDHDTISVRFATKEQIRDGSQGQIVSADGLKEAIAAYSDALYVPGGGIGIQGGTIFAKAAPIRSLIDGTPNETDSVTNGNLNGALGAGRALNVTVWPPTWTSYGDGQAWTVSEYDEYTGQSGAQLKDSCVKLQNTASSTGYMVYGWNTLPNFKTGSKYLLIADIKIVSGASKCQLCVNSASSSGNLPIYDDSGNLFIAGGLVDTSSTPLLTSEWKRYARYIGLGSPGVGLWFYRTTTAAIDVRVKHYLVFDVTDLPMPAIYAIATAEHPELYDKYLVKNDAVCPWMQIHDLGTQTSVSLEAGRAYKLTANDGNTHTIAVNAIPENSYGKETHITILVGSTSNVVLKKPLSLMDPLIANAANNCVIKYRDGKAYLYVDDRDYGYVVTIASGGNVDGTMYYGLRTATDNYILISPALDGTPVNLESATGRAVSVVGNGVNKTILTGNVAPTATTDIHNATFRNVTVTGGQLVLNSDTKVESGSTVGVSGGSVAIKGSTIEPGATVRGVTNITNAIVDGTIVQGGMIYMTNGSITGSGVIDQNAQNIANVTNNTETIISGCTFANGKGAGTLLSSAGATIRATDVLVTNATASNSDTGFFARGGGKIYITNSVVTKCKCQGDGSALCTYLSNAYIYIVASTISLNYVTGTGTIHAAKDTIIDLYDCLITGNTATAYGAALAQNYANGHINATNCLIVSNVAPTGNGAGLWVSNNTGNTTSLTGCTFGAGQDLRVAASSAILYLNGYNKFDAGINSSGSVSVASSAIVDISDSSSSIAGAPITIGDNVTLLTERGRGRCNSCTCSVIDTSGGVILSSCTGTTVTTGRNIVVNASRVWVGENISLDKGYAAAGGCFNVSGNAKVMLSGTTISGCTATTTGGVAYFAGASTMSITNSLIKGNRAQVGSVIYSNGVAATVSISASTIAYNYANNITIAAYSGVTISLSNVLIEGNTSTSDVGAAGYCTGSGVLTITNCYITNNLTGLASGYYSGTIYCSGGGKILVTNTTITGNTSTYGTVSGINGGTQSFSDCVLDGTINSVGDSMSLLVFANTNKFTGKTINVINQLTVRIEPNAVINLRNNENDIPITAQTISAAGNFTVINKYGEEHEYSARTVTGGSTITNMGLWLPQSRWVFSTSGQQARLTNVSLDGFSVTGPGGAILSSNGSTVSLTGVTVTNSRCSGDMTIYGGGGISVSDDSNKNSKIILNNCVITGCSAYSGGGFYTNYSTAEIANTTITSCRSSGFGSAIRIAYSKATVINCTITGNTSGEHAAIVIVDGSTTSLVNCVVKNNVAVTYSALYITRNCVVVVDGGTYDNKSYSDTGCTLELKGHIYLTSTFDSVGLIKIQSGAIIDLTNNNNTNSITGSTITALGSFTVISKTGGIYSFTATSKTNSKITNAGAWT